MHNPTRLPLQTRPSYTPQDVNLLLNPLLQSKSYSEYKYQSSQLSTPAHHPQHYNPFAFQTEEEKLLFKYLAQGAVDDLRVFLNQVSLDLTQLWSQEGYTALHLAGYKNQLIVVQILCAYVMEEECQRQDIARQDGLLISMNPKSKVALWINQPAQGEEGFTVMHFAAFNGNVEMMEYLVQKGANLELIHEQSKSLVSVFHVAAQGDSPSALAFLKKALPHESIDRADNKYATPLHWACYSGAENAVQYLLAWGANVNSQDASGITPLHQAVKSAEEIKSARIVRLLLIKGAERGIRDAYGRKAIDIARECKVPNVQKELITFLDEPNVMQKCMIQTPLQKVQRSLVSVYIFLTLFLLSFIFLLYFLFPDKHTPYAFKVFLSGNFLITGVFFLLSWLTDPGFLHPSTDIDFISIIPKFDPSRLCAECELIKTERCRHCNICNHCVERYDHHCPWINNCVGYKNHAYFYIYIVTLQIYMMTIFGILVYQIRARLQQHVSLGILREVDIYTAFKNGLQGYTNDHLISNLFSLSLLMICLIFMIPLLILVCVQTKNMISNETTSERFSRKKDPNGSQGTNPEEHQQHGSDNESREGQQLREDGCLVSNVARNCLQMSCTQRFESQEELLDKKLKHEYA